MKKPKYLKWDNPCQQRQLTAECQAQVTHIFEGKIQKMYLLKHIFTLYM